MPIKRTAKPSPIATKAPSAQVKRAAMMQTSSDDIARERAKLVLQMATIQARLAALKTLEKNTQLQRFSDAAHRVLPREWIEKIMAAVDGEGDES